MKRTSLGILLVVFLLSVSPVLLFSGGEKEAIISFWKGPHTTSFEAQSEYQVWESLIEKFEKDNPGIKIDMLVIPFGEYSAKMTAGFGSDRPPDVVYIPNEWLYKYAEAGLLLDLDEASPKLMKDLEAVIPNYFWEMGKYAGKQVAIPWLSDGFFLFYNKKHFREVGLNPEDPPENWKELVEYAEKLTRDLDGDGKTDQWGFGVPATSAWDDVYWFWTFLWGAGADILNEDWTANGFNNAKGIQALQFYKDLIRTYKVSPPAGTLDYIQMIEEFLNGKVSMMQDEQINSGRSSREDHPNLELGVAKMPAGPAKWTAWGNLGQVVVSAKTKNKDAAMKWVEYINSPAVLSAYYANSDFWPTRTDVSGESPDNPYLNQMAKWVDYFTMWPLHPLLSEINTRFWEEAEPALFGSKTVEQALQDAANAVDDLVSRSGARPGGK